MVWIPSHGIDTPADTVRAMTIQLMRCASALKGIAWFNHAPADDDQKILLTTEPEKMVGSTISSEERKDLWANIM